MSEISSSADKAGWILRVLAVDVGGGHDVADDGEGVESEGISEQSTRRSAEYGDIIARIDEELEPLRESDKDNKDAIAEARQHGYKPDQYYVDEVATLVRLESDLQDLRDETADVRQAVADGNIKDVNAAVAKANALLREITTLRGEELSRPGKNQATVTQSKAAYLLLVDQSPLDESGKATAKAKANGIKGKDGDGKIAELIEEIAGEYTDTAPLRAKLETGLQKLALAAANLPEGNAVARAHERLADTVYEGDELAGAARLKAWGLALSGLDGVTKNATSLVKDRGAALNALHIAEAIGYQIPEDNPARTELLGKIDTLRTVAGETLTTEVLGKAAETFKKHLGDAGQLQKDAVAAKASLLTAAAVEADFNKLKALTLQAAVVSATDETTDGIRTLVGTTPNFVGLAADKLQELHVEVTAGLKHAYGLMVAGMDDRALDGEMARRAGNPESTSADDQLFWLAAFKKRFDVEIKVPEGLQATKIPQLFKFLARVPGGKGVAKLKSFEYETQAGACLYGKGKIVMANMTKGPSDRLKEMLKYPVPGKPDKEMQDYFNMVTLHEIGHAMDDQQTFMPGKMETAGLGGWKSETLDAVVEKVADLLLAAVAPAPDRADAVKITKRFLLTGKLDKPPSEDAPLGGLFAKWAEIDTFLKGMGKLRQAQKPWNTPTLFGNRYYHEAYAGKWYSYLKVDRDNAAQSVSNYQWRAPGEWFAELYAWNHIEADTDKRAVRLAMMPAPLRPAITG